MDEVDQAACTNTHVWLVQTCSLQPVAHGSGPFANMYFIKILEIYFFHTAPFTLVCFELIFLQFFSVACGSGNCHLLRFANLC